VLDPVQLQVISGALKAACDKGACTGPPIVAWDCTSTAGTKILPKYLPASCR
jgi:hypothetical protein